MAIKHAEDVYGSFGSVSDVKAAGGGGSSMGAHADASAFGGQIGAGLEKVGTAGEQIGTRLGNMISETAANDAEVGFIKASGDLKAKYMQYEGSQAEAMRPQYEAELAQLHSQSRQNLPLQAQHQFDQVTTRSIANQTNEYSSYAAGQVKQGNIKSQEAVSGMAVNSAANLGDVLDDHKVGEALGTITHSGNAIADVRGLGYLASGQDKDTGNYLYPDTPQGQAAKAQHLAYTDSEKAKYFLTGAKTIADNQGPTAAADWAQKHWDLMPDAAKAQMNAYLAPKMRNEKIAGIVNGTLQSAQQDYTQKIISGGNTKPPLEVIRQNEGVGYSKDNKGEVINGINSNAFPKEFAEAKGILDTQGQAAATKYANSFYQKNIIDKYGIGSLPAQTQAIVADGLVNHGGGDFGKSLVQAAKDGASPQQLIDMRRAEYQRLNASGKPEYTSQIDGWNARLDKLQQSIPNPSEPPPPLQQSKGDYYKENEEDLVQQATNAHLQQFPGDEYGAMTTGNRTRTQINHIISMENKQLNSDVNTVQQVIDGRFNNQRKPTTLDEIGMLKPEAKEALERLEQGKPKVVHALEKQLAANAKDEAKKGYGDGFLSTMNRIASDDPTDGISDAHKLAEIYGDKEDLFVKGYGQAGKLLQQAQTPEGKAVIASQAQFLSDLHSKMVAGENDTAGKAAFNKALPSFFSQYDALSKDGKQGMLLKMDDKNPFLQGLKIPNSAEMVSKKIQASTGWLNTFLQGGNAYEAVKKWQQGTTFTPQEKVMSDFIDGKITEQEKNTQLKAMGVVPSAPIPRPQ